METEAKDIPPPQLDKKEVSLPLAKIRSRRRSHQIFGATKLGFSSSAICHACAGLDFSLPVPSILARLLLEQVYGFGVPVSSSLPPLTPSILARLLLEQDCGSGVSDASSFPPPMPSILARLLLEQD